MTKIPVVFTGVVELVDSTEPPVEPPPIEIPPGDEGETNLTRLVELGGVHLGFEGWPNGTPVEVAEPRIIAASDGTISADHAKGGTKSFKTFIDPGEGGYGSYGGILGESGERPPRMMDGGEVWIRWYSYKPDDWKNECDPYMKFMRLETHKRDNDNTGGYSDCYLDGHQIQWISETEDAGWTEAPGIFNLRKGVWECYEMYTKLGSVSKDDGGDGYMIMWKNGIRMMETGHSTTLREAGGYSGRVLWHTWHQHNNGEGGGATRRRHSYLDQWTIGYRGDTKDHGTLDTTSAMARDHLDFPMIGTHIEA
ncbi:hypothetical protein N9937_01355 [bacterium]|nr:hypothetical protein [bacterium]